MLTTKVEDPKGIGWSVSLRLLPLRKGIGLRERFGGRLKKKSVFKNDRWMDFLPVPDGLDDIRIIIVVVIAVVLLYFVGWPLLLLLVDFIWLVLVLLGALTSFVILRRPVTVVASNGKESYAYKARGLFEGRRLKQDIIQQISLGRKLKTSETA